MIARPWVINNMVPQHPPHNIQKHQVAKALLEGDKIQDLTNHKWTDEWGDAKWNTELT
jgi:hypothetical protein